MTEEQTKKIRESLESEMYGEETISEGDLIEFINSNQGLFSFYLKQYQDLEGDWYTQGCVEIKGYRIVFDTDVGFRKSKMNIDMAMRDLISLEEQALKAKDTFDI